MKTDETGVPVYPGDTAGYIVEGIYCSYQYGRLMLASAARGDRADRAAYAAAARELNRQHLRRLLRNALFRKLGGKGADALDLHAIENMPRRDRRVFQLSYHNRTPGSHDTDYKTGLMHMTTMPVESDGKPLDLDGLFEMIYKVKRNRERS